MKASWIVIGMSATLSISLSSIFDLLSKIALEWMCSLTAEVLAVGFSLFDPLSNGTLGNTLVLEKSKSAF